MYDFLKKVPLFADLPDDDLGRLCGMLTAVDLPAGEELFAEGSYGEQAYVIEEGELEIIKVSSSREVLLAVRGSGEVIGEMALLEDKPRMASARARTNTKMLAIHREQLQELIGTSPSAAEAMFYSILKRWRSTEAKLRQSEKMAQLGVLTAGIAHELNNPAAAVKRGAEQLEQAMTDSGAAYIRLSHAELSDDQWLIWQVLTEKAQAQANLPPEMDALTRSDREYELEEWLEDLGVEDGWELAPTLVDLNLSTEERATLSTKFQHDQLGPMIRWLNANYTTYSLFAELRQGAGRISGIVKALKTYSYLDQAPVQDVDIQQGLDDTLLILNHKLKGGPSVRREYTDGFPEILGFGSELNQVWTNILDNAIDAVSDMPPNEAVITIRTRQVNDWVKVEIEDNGPGIPLEIQARIFDPFFTTKPPGVGTGLGLDISYNIVVQKHRGDIKVDSQPGKTNFQIWLPINFETCTPIELTAWQKPQDKS
jgi:signal transduction histidine kinase